MIRNCLALVARMIACLSLTRKPLIDFDLPIDVEKLKAVTNIAALNRMLLFVKSRRVYVYCKSSRRERYSPHSNEVMRYSSCQVSHPTYVVLN